MISTNNIQHFNEILRAYREGKRRLESRVISAENWWRLHNTFEEGKTTQIGADGGFAVRSGWLHNVIVSKHADLMDAFPEPAILPREPGDTEEAECLTDLLPCILETNRFDRVFSDVMWQKLKTGTGVYKVVWDSGKLNGLGDVSLIRVDLLNLFWEPGVMDIQKSPYLFHTEQQSIKALEEAFPKIRGKLNQSGVSLSKFDGEEHKASGDKITVVEVYYKKKSPEGKTLLHHCKYAGNHILSATENDEELKYTGLYDHGKYPFVFDPLYPVEGSPCGYGYVDICGSTQTAIDLMETAMVKNTLVGATPRYFVRSDGSVNEEEFLDLSKPLVHVDGNLGEDSIRQIGFAGLGGNYIALLNNSVEELRQTASNTEIANGTASKGVTAASAIVALQEAGNKTSRDTTRMTYEAYRQVIELVIELIRQFYDLPRQFRIRGKSTAGYEFRTYTNKGLKAVPQIDEFGLDGGVRVPAFDVVISQRQRTEYSRISQNELALRLFSMGFFREDRVGEADKSLKLMDFNGKENLI